MLKSWSIFCHAIPATTLSCLSLLPSGNMLFIIIKFCSQHFCIKILDDNHGLLLSLCGSTQPPITTNTIIKIFTNHKTPLSPFPSLPPFLQNSWNPLPLNALTLGRWDMGVCFFFFFSFLHFMMTLFWFCAVYLVGASITGEDAGFVLPAATRSTPAAIVTTRQRYFNLHFQIKGFVFLLLPHLGLSYFLYFCFASLEHVEESLWSARTGSPRC